MSNVISNDMLMRFIGATPEQRAVVARILEGKVEANGATPLISPSAAFDEGYIGKCEIAKRLGKSTRTIDNWMKRGFLPYIKTSSRSVLFQWGDVQDYLKQNYRVCRGRDGGQIG